MHIHTHTHKHSEMNIKVLNLVPLMSIILDSILVSSCSEQQQFSSRKRNILLQALLLKTSVFHALLAGVPVLCEYVSVCVCLQV